jgi:signal transduction histidine kinase
MTPKIDPSPQAGGLAKAVKAQWHELGGFGRVGVIGLVLSLALAIALGFLIPELVRRNLIDERTNTLTAVARGLPVLDSTQGSKGASVFEDEVRLRLLGGNTVRVKLWSRDGTILYSDAEALVGRRFAPSTDLIAAFGGAVHAGRPDLRGPENEFERDLGDLIEFYVPIEAENGTVVNVFEVYDDSTSLEATVAATRKIVWLSILAGLGVLGVFMLSLTVANARILSRRASEAERLLSELAHAQDNERLRVIGALHDDIGQPLYRVLHGVEGARSRVEANSPVADELGRIGDLLRSIDGTLKTELRLLHHGSIEQLDLDTLLREIADRTQAETDLEITLEIQDHDRLTLPLRAALFRAAREALTNARKHAMASTVAIRLYDGNGRVILDVEDNGVGLDGAPGLGLVTTRERLEALGGGLHTANLDDTGTLFRAWVPPPATKAAP